MVRLDERLDRIKRLYVDKGKYFIINRGRQYGKTTTLKALAEYLKDDYIVIAMDFQLMSNANFADEQTFVIKFINYMEDLFSEQEMFREKMDAEAFNNLIFLKEKEEVSIDMLFRGLSKLCGASEKPIVMIIDEVDSVSNNQVFIDFLAMLRGYYLGREEKAAFHSVILAAVYDIKNLKLKIRSDKEHRYNSPWNIAAKFNIDMFFDANQICSMLEEYETDHQTGMNIKTVAEEIYQYTSGYPYLVSAVCKYLDEEVPGKKGYENNMAVWSPKGVAEAVKILLNEKSPLFDSMAKQLDAYKDLRNLIEEILYQGKRIPFSPDAASVDMGCMFGFLKEKDGQVVMANRIFEMRMLNKFITEEALKSDAFRRGERDRNQFITDKGLNMERVLQKFVEYFHDVYGENDEKFVENYGRKFFLLYLKPIINGTGNYYMEAQTRDAGRTDVIVDYLGEQFIVEMKIWRGNEYHERGERRLLAYLDYFHQKKGYMLSFNFNRKKEIGVKKITIGDKMIVEAVV